MTKHIKQIAAYRINLPADADLEGHLSERVFRDIQPQELSTFGFTDVPIMGSGGLGLLVEKFDGGCAIALRIDEKIMPASAVNAEVKRRCAAAAEERGVTRLARVAMKEIREVALIEMAAAALVGSRIVTAFYHRASRLLLVNGSKKHAAMLVGSLVQAVGAAKTETIHVSNIKGGLTTRLSNWLSDEDHETAFDKAFSPGCDVWLRREKERVTVQTEDLRSNESGLKEALASGFQVSAMTLAHNNTGVLFKISDDFRLSSIHGHDVEIEHAPEDAYELWQQEVAVQITLLVAMIEDLCAMFDYKEPGAQDGEPQKMAA